ncbi:hypothetical protein XH98_17110 [Bradyrhizobium sp. CCBAU 51745]|uniref:hypothetical protein n=1 Tax=Bradyrhizobium sp. CCBAU 51745 TaxID=1325099 RepID=UPI002304FF54|nr:hypothetical protein [Bradyrhizobium sp. CCBAU 51745]MDA9440784.1 hypothetical protein [Bradyrhizobium sp. CCBAU 51745]
MSAIVVSGMKKLLSISSSSAGRKLVQLGPELISELLLRSLGIILAKAVPMKAETTRRPF